MSRETEFLTSNRYIRYPFSTNSRVYYSTDTLDRTLERAFFGCFVDAMVQMKPGYRSLSPIIKVEDNINESISFSISDSLYSYESKTLICSKSSTKFPVISGETSWCWYTFVMSSDGIIELSHLSLPRHIKVREFTLEDKCIGYSTEGVTSLHVYDGDPDPSTGLMPTLSEVLAGEMPHKYIVTGDVSILPGYNMQITNGTTTYSIEDAKAEDIKLNAIAGAGLGKIKCESKYTHAFKTPGLISADGHVRLFNDTCYDLVPDKEDDTGILKMHVKCKACCTCEMYSSIVKERLIPLKNSILNSRSSIYKTLDTYESNVAKWNYRIAHATADDIIITTNCVALDAAATNIAGNKVLGKMDRCGCSVLVRNDSFVDVTINYSDFMSNGVPFESQISYIDKDNEPVINQVDLTKNTNSATLSPGKSATLTYFVRLNNMVSTDHQSGFLSRITVAAYQGSDKIVSTIKVLSL